jgi:exonuclease VII large subunit
LADNPQLNIRHPRYSHKDGKLVKKLRDAAPGDVLNARLSDGILSARVEEKRSRS